MRDGLTTSARPFIMYVSYVSFTYDDQQQLGSRVEAANFFPADFATERVYMPLKKNRRGMDVRQKPCDSSKEKKSTWG